MSREIPLNILFNYPVHWDEYRVLRDFVQNFYDAKPYDRWWKEFDYQYDEENKILTMSVRNSGFSYEWLLHIGASNKTNSDTAAGYYGEGFKIATLCAIRDYNWSVRMASRDWEITGTGKRMSIDGTYQRELIYQLKDREFSDNSILTLGSVEKKEYLLFLEVLQGFYYPENPLLGKLIYSSDSVAVYEKSDKEIPDSLPQTYEFGKVGAVFVRYQMLGTLPFNNIIAFHSYQQEDRERSRLREHDVLKTLYMVAERLDAKTASYLLRKIPDKWNAYPKRLVDVGSWYYIVCELIRKISYSRLETALFHEDYPLLVYANRFMNHDILAQNRRNWAKKWIKCQPFKYRIVMEQFELLDYPMLEDVCEKAGGFADDSTPTQTEEPYLEILRDITKRLFAQFFFEEVDVPYRIIRKRMIGYVGKAEIVKLTGAKSKIRNKYGLSMRYQLQNIAIREDYLRKECFSEALSTHLHEMAHMFGGDSTENFSHALTKLIEMTLQNADVLNGYRKKWEAL